MPRNMSWHGTHDECAALIRRLYTEAGELYKYNSVLDAPADIAYMNEHKDKIKSILPSMPRLNGRWSTFKEAILNWNPKGYGNMSAERIKEAEDDATKLRCIFFHIRREWYKRSNVAWVVHFQRPSDNEESTPVAAAAPSNDAGPALVAAGNAAAVVTATSSASEAVVATSAAAGVGTADAVPCRATSFASAFYTHDQSQLEDSSDDSSEM